ncbi:ROK family protein [Clostridium sp.]|uniref:ROK family protein n=1 Tax=Clostridium sp. TaxID=1506 RepID=UPI0032176200
MYIGIDLGGTNVGIGIVDNENKLIYKDSIPTKSERGFNEIVEDIVDLISRIININNISKEHIQGIGIGVPGIVDPKSGIVIDCVNLRWNNVDIKGIIENKLNIPVSVGNDATVAGVAELVVGAMKGCQTGVLITLGTGIGGGIIINEEVYDGFHGVGSEIGHMIVGENYYNCNCGRNGCLETFSSSTAIIRYVRKLIEEGNDSAIMAEVKGNLNSIDGKVIFDQAKAGDKVACKVIDRMTNYLAIGIMNIISVIDPEVFVIGGGLSATGEYLISIIRDKVSQIAYYKGMDIGEIILSRIGNDGGIIGAAALCRYR